MFMLTPYFEEVLAQLDTTGFSTELTPGELLRYKYWQRALVQRLISTYQINGLPDEWVRNKDFLDFLLIYGGFVIITELPKYGLVFSAGTLTGFDFYYQPVTAMLINPKENGKTFEVGKTCEILKFTPDFRGVMDVVNKHARHLAMLDTNIDVAIAVAKVPFILAGKNDTAVAAVKAIVKQVREGKYACFYDKAIKDTMTGTESTEAFELTQLFKASDYMVNEFLESLSLVLSNFDAEVGIPTVPYEKKERLVTSEADSRKLDATARLRTWVDTLNTSMIDINKHYGLHLTAALSVDEFEDEQEKENADADQETETDNS